MGRFEGQTVVVTGGVSGIGLAIVRAFAKEGAKVVAGDVAAAPATGGDGGFPSNARLTRLDIADESSWQALFAGLREQRQLPSILVNCAGLMRVADLEATDASLFDLLTQVNARGTMLGCKFAIPEIVASGRHGAIVNVASTAAIKTAPWIVAYAASKAAVVSLTKSVALHCGQHQYPIRCNAVLPGPVHTPMIQPMIDAAPNGAAVLAGLAVNPLGRLVTADEVANAVLFLASGEASGITGATLAVDGGLTAT